MTTHPRFSVAVSVAVVMLSACFDESISATCADDQACPGDTVCAFGLCVDPAVLAAVDVEVEPVAGSGLPAQTVFGVSSETGARVDVSLASAVTVRGGVVSIGDGGIAATVTAVPDRAIAGRRRQPATSTDDGAFSFLLVEGEGYRLQALPTERSLPPILPDVIFVAGEDDPPELVMTSTTSERGVIYPITVRGQLVAGVGVAPQPISGVEVLLADGEDRRASSLAITDAEGRFEVGLAERPENVRFIARASEQNALSPTLEFPLELGPEDVIDLGPLSLGPSLGVVRVQGEVRDEGGAPVDGAIVSWRGLIGAGVAEARTETIAGRFSVSLHPGLYTLAVVGPATANAGMSTTTVQVGQGTSDIQVTLPARVSAAFTVSSFFGEPVAFASVVLTRVGDSRGVADPVLAAAEPVFLGSTDEDGGAFFAVDPGRYRIAIQPPRGSEAPLFSTLVTVSESGLLREVVMPSSMILAGTLRDPGGATVVGAYVRVFSTLSDESGNALLLGEGLSADDGTFEVFIPVQ
jgi:hypothetical protein